MQINKSKLTLLHEMDTLGGPAAWHGIVTFPPTFLWYSASGRLTIVGGSLISIVIGFDFPWLPRMLYGWQVYSPACFGDTCRKNCWRFLPPLILNVPYYEYCKSLSQHFCTLSIKIVPFGKAITPCSSNGSYMRLFFVHVTNCTGGFAKTWHFIIPCRPLGMYWCVGTKATLALTACIEYTLFTISISISEMEYYNSIIFFTISYELTYIPLINTQIQK